MSPPRGSVELGSAGETWTRLAPILEVSTLEIVLVFTVFLQIRIAARRLTEIQFILVAVLGLDPATSNTMVNATTTTETTAGSTAVNRRAMMSIF